MNRTLYFEICENIEEFRKLKQLKGKKIKTYEIQLINKISKYKIINKIIKKVNSFKYAIFIHCNIIKKIESQEKTMYIIFTLKQNNKKILNKLNKKIENELNKNPCTKIILSKKIKQLSEENFRNSKKNIVQEIIKFYRENKELYFDYMEYILNSVIYSQKSTPQEQSVYILVKENKLQYINKITKIISNYKSINIVTPNIDNFKKLEAKLEESMEIIAISNNKRKSLSKAKYIINIDFDESDILQYNINRTAVIFNTCNTQIKIKNFDGIIINNINLKSQEKFNIVDEYIANKTNGDVILNRIKNREYNLLGNNGYITLW